MRMFIYSVDVDGCDEYCIVKINYNWSVEEILSSCALSWNTFNNQTRWILKNNYKSIMIVAFSRCSLA
jgi:hypothetical protein